MGKRIYVALSLAMIAIGLLILGAFVLLAWNWAYPALQRMLLLFAFFALLIIGLSLAFSQPLARLLYQDQLTGIYNRSAFFLLANRLCKKGKPFSIILLDIDDFKSLNDLHGHTFGDNILINLAWDLRQIIGPYPGLFRLGGDEFIVCLPGTSEAESKKIGKEIEKKISTPLSLGMATWQKGDATTVLEAADKVMYQAKKAKRLANSKSDSILHTPS